MPERDRPVHRVLARERGRLAVNAGQRHMRPERPFLALTEGLQQSRVEGGEFGVPGAFDPEQARPLRLRPIANTLVRQGEGLKPLCQAAEPGDGIGDRGFIPRRDQRQVDVGRRDQADRGRAEGRGQCRKLQRDLRGDPEADEQTCRRCLRRGRRKRQILARGRLRQVSCAPRAWRPWPWQALQVSSPGRRRPWLRVWVSR